VKVLGVLAVVAAWLLLHAGYARYYVYLYYDAAAPGGLRFPDDARPAVVDFTYMSLSIGTSFAVSDVEVTSQRVRYVVMSHSVVGSFYNTLVIAVVVGVLTQSSRAARAPPGTRGRLGGAPPTPSRVTTLPGVNRVAGSQDPDQRRVIESFRWPSSRRRSRQR
jgi:hypothetical protein